MQWLPDPLPPETASAVREGADRMAAAIVAAVSAENPTYAAVLADPSGLGIRLGIEEAVRSFIDAVEAGTPPAAQTDELWRRLGEAEFQAGRPLEALRSAFRTGARAAWRAAAEIAGSVGLDAAQIVGLAEGIFVYSDELAADVVEGYLRMQTDEAGERERRRRRLATLLVDPAGHDPEMLERAADLAGWALPRTLAALVAEPEAVATIAGRLGGDALLGGGERPFLLIVDPLGPQRMTALRRAVLGAGAPAALGAVTAPVDAADSLRWARAAHTLIAAGVLPPGSPLAVDEHLADLVLHADARLAVRLADRTLAPFAPLSPGERERLTETLRTWLAHQRHTPAVAVALHVHPQTVRYRLARVRELFGEALEDPERRLAIELALRVRSPSS